MNSRTLRRKALVVAAASTITAILAAPPAPADAADHITVTPQVPPANEHGWYRETPVVTLDVDSPTGAIGTDSRLAVHTQGGGTVSRQLSVGSNTAPLGEGIDTVVWKATNPFTFTTEAQGQLTVRIDSTDPVITLDQGIENDAVVELGAQIELQFHCTDALSGLTECQTALGQQETAMLDTSQPGGHNVAIFATDKAGNEVDLFRHYTVVAPDTTAPTVSITKTDGFEGNDGWFLKPPTFHVEASDPVVPFEATSGVEALDTDLDGVVTEVTTPGTDVTVGAGRHVLKWAARDVAQNASGIESMKVDVDLDAPRTEVDYPLEGQHLSTDSSATPVFDCADDTSGLRRCFVSEGAAPGSTEDAARLDLTPGAHTITFAAVDIAGRGIHTDVHYVVDPPAHPVVGSSTTIARVRASHRKAGTMVVRIASQYAPSGSVAVYDGRHRIATTAIPTSAAHAGTTTVKLRIPQLHQGKHRLRATYLGAADIRRSTSSTTVVRVR